MSAASESTPPSRSTPASPLTSTPSIASRVDRDPASRKAGRERRSDAKLALLLACGAAFMSVFDFSAVNIALPDLRRDFSAASLPTLSWVITSYLVLFAAVLPSAGRLADVLGHRRLFQWSVVAFGVTSVLCAAAPNEEFLIAVRALQGAAAAAMSPSGLGLVLRRTAPERTMSAIGTWSAVSAVAAVVAPGLGGVLVDAWGWRAIFVINVPIVVAILGIVGRLSRDDPRDARLPDLLGTALLTAGIGAVVVGISQGSDWGWRSGSVLVALTGGAALVVVSLARSARHPAPAFELDLWRDRTFTVANATMLPMNIALVLSLVAGPLFLTSVWGYSVLQAGLAGTPTAFALAVAGVLTGRLATTPAARRVAAVGGCLLFAGSAVFLGTALSTEPRFLSVILPAGLVAGFGYGASFTAVFGAGSISVPPTRLATGNAMLGAMRILGAALGTAAVAAILATPGNADTGAVDSYLTAYLLSGAVAVMAAMVGVGLLRPVPAEAAEADEGQVSSAPRARRLRRPAAALAVVASLLAVGAFSVATGTTGDCDAGDEIDGACTRAEVTPAEPAEHTPSQQVRNLTLIDISASTTEPVGPGLTRLDASTQAARNVIAAMPDDTELGVWLYARQLNGELDWAELVPVGPLRDPYGPATRRRQLDFGLDQIAAIPEVRTGLYDTVLAAYRATQRGYDPKLVNSLLLFTDGTNDDPGGIPLSGLLAALRGEYDPARPVHTVIVGIGDDVDHGALTQIADATRGSVHLARAPGQVHQILLTAISGRTAEQ